MIYNDPVKNPFNDWLKDYGVYVAISIAVILLIIVITLLVMNKHNSKPKK